MFLFILQIKWESRHEKNYFWTSFVLFKNDARLQVSPAWVHCYTHMAQSYHSLCLDALK